MNRRPPGLKSVGLNISAAIPGFIQFKGAEGLSPRTIESYERDLFQWLEYEGDKDVGRVSSTALLAYLNWLRTDYVPRRISGRNEKKLSPKTIRNVHISLSAFFTWASREFDVVSPMKGVPSPRVPKIPVNPYSKSDIEALLKVCDYCEEARTDRRRKFTMRRTTGKRDKAMILMLLDSGLRATELCSLRVGDVDMKTGKVIIRPGPEGGAKGGSGRTVFLGKSVRRVLWRYLVDREDGTDPEAPLFLVKEFRPMNRDALRQIISALGQKAGVEKCHPHRFRHTFAITYLRSGGDIFTLKLLLGHRSLEMVEHYAQVAEVDLETAHRRASPADNWHL